MLDDSVLTHPLLHPVGVDVLLASHPWNPQANDTPVVYPARPPRPEIQPPGQSIFINGNSRVEQRTKLVGNAIEFKPYPATATDLDAMNALVGTYATVYILYKGAGRQGRARVTHKPGSDSSAYVLHLLHTFKIDEPAQSKVAWADME